MRRGKTIPAIVLCVCSCVLVASGVGQSSPCTVSDHAEYGKKIKEYTTEPYFITELVDHLPLSSCVPAPDAFFHHIMGAPDVLDYNKDLNAYMRLLAEKSPRVKVFSIGTSEEGREMLAAVVSDEENLARLDRYKQILGRLADPRGLSEPEAQKLIAEGKPIYWADGSIHSPETGSPEMLMELAYRLAVEDTPFIQKIRKDSIVMITPVVETDGHDRMVDIYMHRKKHPSDAPYPLIWWGHYVAHDNNRDSLGMNLALSRNMLKNFLEWHPTVMHDLHESVPYLYIMTGTGPYNAWLDPIVISEWQEMAYHEIQEMTKRGVIGVWTHGFYDGWAPNYLLSIANNHNAIGRFYETFGNGGADTRVRTLPAESTSRDWFRPNPPLPKVKWSARNNINMQESAILFGMNNVAEHGSQFLNNFYLKSRRSVEKARKEGPAAWVFPADDPRPGEQASLLMLLELQGVEIHKMDKELRVQATPGSAEPAARDGKAADDKRTKETAEKKPTETVIPPGSYVVRMDQPYSRLADMVLDTQYYSPRDPRSYDDTGWTLGALRNVKTIRVIETSILEAPMQKMGDIESPGGVSGEGATLVINHNSDNALATFRYRFSQVAMEAAEEPFEADGIKFNAGSFVIRHADSKLLDQAGHELGIKIHATRSEVKVPTHPVAAPRVALVHNWQNTQNDGWFRLAFESVKVPYTYLADTKIRETPNLRHNFDVIILPPLGGFGPTGLSSMIRGIPLRGNALPWKNSDDASNLVAPGLDSTDDIRGGLGYSGLANLERFVREGGLLIAVQSSTSLPVAAAMTDMVNVTEPRTMQAPGSVVLSTVEDKKSPIAYGYGDKLYIYFRQGPVISVSTGLGNQGQPEGGAAGRASGRGSVSDPDVIQGRPYIAQEKEPKRSPRDQELYISEDAPENARWFMPAREDFPRVVLRFAAEKELLLSGMITAANELADKPAIVDVPHGKGHVVLFANNPMWRGETTGSFFLVFNAMMNYEHLNVGASTASRAPAFVGAGGEGDQQ